MYFAIILAESETPCSDIKPTDEAQEASVDSTAGKIETIFRRFSSSGQNR